ncbi:uncharacterized protein C8A04DRAFT_27098 [Dichotomopilus funicola]|uniref:Uncharacterized protein n=1 Tax=Dichotomopilus funicola TaxID=1934379 RepID=A0AAN6V600_9PEZI|nr:hypothetical protein C8A04DRAFT_27098 [Dichotomopilus funicola]
MFSLSLVTQLHSVVKSASRDKDKDGSGPNPDESYGQLQLVPATKRYGPRRIKRVEEGSIYDILHDHAGTALHVLPICWTDQHTLLLGVRFTKNDAIVKPIPDVAPNVWLEASKMAQTLTSELHTLARHETTPQRRFCKTRAMKHIFSTLFPSTMSCAKTGAELNLYLGRHVFKKVVRIPCLWKSSSNAGTESSFDSCPTIPATSFGAPSKSRREGGLPVLAYITKAHLASIRNNLYRCFRPAGSGTNEPIQRLQELRHKMLVPADADHDPYIVAMLIAMAQAHIFRESSPRSSPSSSQGRGTVHMLPVSFRDVTVQVIMHDEGQSPESRFSVYTATITKTFLKRFMFPYSAPEGQAASQDAGINITYTPVNFWPILGLKERLAKALGEELGGEGLYADPEHIGLWEPLLDIECQKQYQKQLLADQARQHSQRRQQYQHLPRPLHPVRPLRSTQAYQPASLKRRRTDREPLSCVLNESNSSFEEEPSSTAASNSSASSGPEDCPVLSPAAKRRRTGRRVNNSTLEVC